MIQKTALFIMIGLQIGLADESFRKPTAVAYQTDSIIKIDGRLDEVVWQNAKKYDNFLQRDPVDGSQPSLYTVFSVLYDDENLYVGIHAKDPEPDKIVGILSRRDEYTPSDWLYISIDSFNDKQTAFEFGINAKGVKHDLRRYNDTNADWDWDAVWDAQSAMCSDGWCAEFAIPLRELRFTSSENMEWGFMVYRKIPRFNGELDMWGYFSKDEPGFVSNYGTLIGLQDFRSGRSLYIMPYLLSDTRISDNLINTLHPESYQFSGNIGTDIRYSFANGLTFNATINPDFGQVEADPASYNLTQYETYYREKRPFFMEGSNILNFQLGIGDGDLGSNTLFYSRRIGRAPQFLPRDKNAVYSDQSHQSAILSAAKLTGKTSSGLSIGAMNAISREERATLYFTKDSTLKKVTEPMTSYSLGRLQKDFRGGDIVAGAYLTGMQRRLENTGLEDLLRREAYTGGIDLRYQFLDKQYAFSTFLAGSRVSGSAAAISKTQTSPAHLYQRPDADYLSVDSSATTLSGLSNGIILSKQSGHWQGAVGGVSYSPGFEPNDMGYLRKADLINQFIWIAYQEWVPGQILKSYQINFNQWQNYTFGSEKRSHGGNINANATLNNHWHISAGINLNFPSVSPDLLRGGPAVYHCGNSSFWIGLYSDDRKDFSGGLSAYHFRSDDDITSFNFNPEFTYRFSHNVKMTLDLDYTDFKDTWTWVEHWQDSQGKDHYIFSAMDQKTVSSVLRFDVTLTRDLSMQYYGQSFITAGKYFDFIEFDDYLAADFDQRFYSFSENQISYDESEKEYTIDYGDEQHSFSKPDFNFKQFNSNLVTRWEFRPGSTVYFVWSQGIIDIENVGQFRHSRDFKRLIESTSNNVLLLKFTYLINI
ncbi:MAG TPA: hypothetical protein ENN84_00220 [Candidatus Marinimicrobia bacterium]|nr:hypothetical protein [Candidatus Neomarinimicrobiota bacterium]